MKAFAALVQREFIEHRGAFFFGPLLLVAVVVAMTVLAFTVGRVDIRFTASMVTVLPGAMLFWPALVLGVAWGLYLLAVLFFYCADGFAADKRNNSMLFWKSMPVSDFRMLLSKLVAAITILPGAVYGVVLISLALMLATAQIAMMINGTSGVSSLLGLWTIFWNVALIDLVQLVVALLWYLPFMALVGAMAVVVGRWAIPIAVLLPTLVATLEWVTLGGLHPFETRTWHYLSYRATMPQASVVDQWIADGPLATDINAGVGYALDLISRIDWLQVGIGAVFAVLVLYIASEYRRRASAN
jgi:ABC-2 type transport system permease protein